MYIYIHLLNKSLNILFKYKLCGKSENKKCHLAIDIIWIQPVNWLVSAWQLQEHVFNSSIMSNDKWVFVLITKPKFSLVGTIGILIFFKLFYKCLKCNR